MGIREWFRPAKEKLMDAAREGNVDRARAILSRNPGLVHARDEMGWTPLHAAVDANQMEAARLLLDAGADVNARNMSGFTVLYAATYGGGASKELVEMLLRRGANRSMAATDGDTPLKAAQRANRADLVSLLGQH